MKLVQPIDKLLLICVNFIDSTTGVINWAVDTSMWAECSLKTEWEQIPVLCFDTKSTKISLDPSLPDFSAQEDKEVWF